MPQLRSLDSLGMPSSSSSTSRHSDLVASESTCLLRRGPAKYRSSPRFFRRVTSCSRREVATVNQVGKEAMVRLGCLELLAEKPLSTPKLLSVMAFFSTARMTRLTDHNRLVALAAMAASK